MNIDQPASVSVEQLAVKPLTFAGCRFRRRPVRIQHPQQTVDRAGIPSTDPRRVPRRSAAPLSRLHFHLDKALYVSARSLFYGDIPLLQPEQELASRRNIVRYHQGSVAIPLQVGPKSASNG